MNYAQVEDALTRFATYTQGWDSYGAAPIDGRAIETARRLLSRLDVDKPNAEQPIVVPLSSGGIQIGWRAEDITIGIDAAGLIECVSADHQYAPQSLVDILAAVVLANVEDAGAGQENE